MSDFGIHRPTWLKRTLRQDCAAQAATLKAAHSKGRKNLKEENQPTV
jgi:hypothetical protein